MIRRRQPWRSRPVWRHSRGLRVTANAAKNPYYFYDLQRQQPAVANSQAEDATFTVGHRTFDPLATQSTETMQQRVRRVFGDLGSREESRKEAMAKGITVAGIHVPARPEEPTNCCMSGCVNCVWELYKDELEEWRAVRKSARTKLEQPQYNHVKWPPQLGAEPSNRRAGSDAAEVAREAEEEDDEDLNTGIKAFIETERRIRAKREKQEQEQQQQKSHLQQQAQQAQQAQQN